ncbi:MULTISPECIES: bifunctional DNA-formamidopyrimidine glycosylase/DNA-(apurinic or apyrimidinic site) lyase [unclassified Corynebacterium]|uniref:bifunctional DNA-formamidopyrimidine glycosylase/DNA-(apurinic or apyrimidinic site) lyase n=1 Tax=unclassified Corynebacterium TaxID=2624378 RepID=UPI0021688856|nr:MULTISPECIES: bifunctional DNA-formamidopyrimidine glycosylase/DNA-(apurinic or apyrimidinic site) lyase [unclassified Corynebacterium]MCS4489065.1 bifunctional DNA-formamidopyrimidine glycosylase/DNA-(apurinic or apyrimidinic site) lyase [Corynebacterium sp. ES2775-CONJ]MCS4531239.1 bifunctional DNA-formamidopyrimidine glycosylase/DNA-(apurinic or apyrimidinic site) lyase [Corynebacterium sp. ES2730-CONJ]
MPELPEVEVVRQGLNEHITGRNILELKAYHSRAIRHIAGGEAQLQAALIGRRISAVNRRGKFLWLSLENANQPLKTTVIVHLGMSGQMLVKNNEPQGVPTHTHLRIRVLFSDNSELWFVDQRTFGYWDISTLEMVHGREVPARIRHIAPDLMEKCVDLDTIAARIKHKDIEIKRILLNQEIVSGIGNIYADEMLWRARVHPQQRASRLSIKRIIELLQAGRDVMTSALREGGTSFDSQYVNVNGQSGYFSRSLHAYGQTGLPCQRCGQVLIRLHVAGRSSHLCPNCQRRH